MRGVIWTKSKRKHFFRRTSLFYIIFSRVIDNCNCSTPGRCLPLQRTSSRHRLCWCRRVPGEDQSHANTQRDGLFQDYHCVGGSCVLKTVKCQDIGEECVQDGDCCEGSYCCDYMVCSSLHWITIIDLYITWIKFPCIKQGYNYSVIKWPWAWCATGREVQNALKAPSNVIRYCALVSDIP